jgi:RNA polymerase sigma factor (sigma-70 family)
MEASRADRRPRPRKSLRLLKRTVDPAFEQLYRTHAREVYQYALALLTNPADAEDATQTTFLNAYRAFQRGERPNKPHNWLIAITHNVCRMRWRQAGSRPREVAFDEAPEPVALEHERPNLDEVLAALARLTFNQRSALVMRELEGRSYQEIAGVLDLSVGAVEALLFRARRRLQLDRKALGVLSTAPLPGSLTSFLGAGGGAVAGGGATVGAGVVLKAAAVVVAGAVTAGVGFKSVEAISAPATPAAAQANAPLIPAGQKSAPASLAQPVRRTAKVHTPTSRSATPVTGVTRSIEPSAASNVASPTQDASPLSSPIASIASTVSTVATAVGVTVPVPVPPAPVLPPPPVTVPPLPPLPPPPPLPITVTTPTLPPPPIK